MRGRKRQSQFSKDIKRELRKMCPSESVTNLLPQGGIYYRCFQGVDKSLSEGYLLRGGKPFNTLTGVITVSSRNKTKDYSEVNNSSAKRSRPIKHGPVNQIVKDGKRIE